MIRFTLLMITFLLGSSWHQLSAQPTVADIKLSGNYHWGEGIAVERSAAEDLARQNLVSRIVVLVTSEQSQTEQEIGTEYASEFRSRTRATSRLQLRGLQYHSEQRRDRSWLVIAYIHKDTFNESLRVEEERILTKLDEAESFFRNGMTSQAMPRYQEVYLSTFFHPAPLYTDAQRHGQRALVRGFAQSRINDWLRALEVQVSGVRSRTSGDHVELYVYLSVTDSGRPVDQLQVRLNRAGYGAHRVTSGSVSVYLDQAPDSRIQPLELDVRLNPAVLNDESLHELAGDLGPSVVRNLPVDFSPVIQVDMRPSSQRGNQLFIAPVISNLSVFSVEWQLPGGGVSRDPVLTHVLGDRDELITLVVNNSPDLSVRKRVTTEGQLVDAGADRSIARSGGGSASGGGNISGSGSVSGSGATSGGGQAAETSGRTDTRPNRPSPAVREEDRAPHPNPRPTPQPSPQPTTPLPGASLDVAPSHSQFIQHIIRIRNAEQLTAHFTQLQQRDVIMFGQRSSVTHPERSYLAIIDQQSREVVAIVSPVANQQRRNLRTNETFADSELAAQFRGMGAIWFQFN